MTHLAWSRAVELIESHVVRISTPDGSGTGFLISNAQQNDFCAVATAAHVVEHAHYWEQPIRIDHTSGESVVVRRDERAVMLDPDRDTAAILFLREDLPLPPKPLALTPEKMFLKVGNQIGWLGFPAIPAASLCFFTGSVSAWLADQSAYLVDGVAINGVSGGPAFLLTEPDQPTDQEEDALFIMGVVSAYMPNRATGEVLPGLSVVRDVAQFHELAPRLYPSIRLVRPSRPPHIRRRGQTLKNMMRLKLGAPPNLALENRPRSRYARSRRLSVKSRCADARTLGTNVASREEGPERSTDTGGANVEGHPVRDICKFLAGAFFVSSGVLFYLYLAKGSAARPLLNLSTDFVETPKLSGVRSIPNFILFVAFFYLGFIRKWNGHST